MRYSLILAGEWQSSSVQLDNVMKEFIALGDCKPWSEHLRVRKRHPKCFFPLLQQWERRWVGLGYIPINQKGWDRRVCCSNCFRIFIRRLISVKTPKTPKTIENRFRISEVINCVFWQIMSFSLNHCHGKNWISHSNDFFGEHTHFLTLIQIVNAVTYSFFYVSKWIFFSLTLSYSLTHSLFLTVLPS